MNLRCPSCSDTFEIPDGMIPPTGAVFACPGCQVSFTALASGLTMVATPQATPPPRPAPVPAGPASASSPFVSLATPAAGSASPSSPSATPPPTADLPVLEPGMVLLDQFEVEAVLGRGGSAVVYRARDRFMGEAVALKTVAGFGGAAALAVALGAEYRAQCTITDSRHVLRVDRPLTSVAAGMDWVMLPSELAAGSLRSWLQATAGDREGRLERGLELLRQACAGLEAVHAAGLVHLDVKPENLLLVGEGKAAVVKVADFGLTRGVAMARPELEADGLGTPAYMAPEQVLAARPKDVGPEADVYGLGMILYELLDGDLPYAGTADQIRAKKLNREIQIKRPEGPAHLADLAMRCLDREPDQRPTVAEVAAGLVVVDPEEERAFAEAESSGSEKGWRSFLSRYGQGPHGKAAMDRLHQMVCLREAREKAEAERQSKEADLRRAREEEVRRDARRQAEMEAARSAHEEQRRREEELRQVEEEKRRLSRAKQDYLRDVKTRQQRFGCSAAGFDKKPCERCGAAENRVLADLVKGDPTRPGEPLCDDWYVHAFCLDCGATWSWFSYTREDPFQIRMVPNRAPASLFGSDPEPSPGLRALQDLARDISLCPCGSGKKFRLCCK